jgi:histidyl-tRNA synthetase
MEVERMQAPRPFRGMRDILPGELDLRLSVIGLIRDTFRKHGFFEIETPMVESLDTLAGSDAGENEHLMFKILKRGEKLDLENIAQENDLVDGALRFDLTVPLARFYSINQSKLPRPFSAMQLGPVFRAERPQKGRFRQFIQADIDILGDPSYLAEVQLLVAATAALHAIGIEGFEIRINDRRVLEAMLDRCGVAIGNRQSAMVALDKLDKVGVDAVKSEMQAKGISEKAIVELFQLLDSVQGGNTFAALVELGVTSEAVTNIEQIVDSVRRSTRDVEVVFDPLIVRGLGYYTSTVYEFIHPSWPGSIAGGGRYDSMLGRFGLDSPAAGVSLGFERIVGLMEELGITSREGIKRLMLIFDPAEQAVEALSKARHFRREGYCVSLIAHPSGGRSPMKRIALTAEELRAEGSRDSFYYFTIGVDREPRLLMHG